MHQVLFGALSALSFGSADFLASLSSRRLGALRAITGMMLVSAAALTVAFMLMGDFRRVGLEGTLLSVVHGTAFAFALALYFRAMATGPVYVAAPIISAHPLFIIAFALAAGSEPTLLQSVAMLGTIAGVAIVAAGGSSASDGAPNAASTLHAFASSIVYAIAVVAAQKAVPLNGEFATIWVGRLSGLIALAALFAAKREPLHLPKVWWPFFCAHGLLDTGGLLFLLFGSGRDLDEITAVVASAFGAVTVALAWIFLDERMTPLRLLGIGMTFFCVGTLAYSS